MTTLDLPRHWIIHGQPDAWGIDNNLTARKTARLNGAVYVAGHIRRKA